MQIFINPAPILVNTIIYKKVSKNNSKKRGTILTEIEYITA